MKIILRLCLILLANLSIAQPPMFTNGVACYGPNFLLANKGTKSVVLINSAGNRIHEWTLDRPATGIVEKNGIAYVTSSYEKGYLCAIDLNKNQFVYKVETGMGACAPVFSVDGRKIFVCNQYVNTISEIDLLKGKVLREVRVEREPIASAVTPDGKYLLVNNHLPAQRADLDIVGSDVSIIDLSSFTLLKTIKLDNGSNALRGICVSPDGKLAFISHNLGRFQVPTSQLQQGWMNTNAVSIIDIPTLSFVASILMDEPDRGAAGIWGVGCTSDKLYVTQSGTHDLSVVDLKLMRERLEKYPNKSDLSYDLSFMYGIRKRIPLVGNGPRSFILNKDRLIVPSYFSDTLNVLDLKSEKVAAIAYNPHRTESKIDRGEKAFNDATYCYQNWQSCNGCHPGDGRTDGMNWDLMNDGIGNPKNCKSLLYAHVTPPCMISGIRATAELAVHAGFKFIQFSEVDTTLLENVNEYVRSLRPLPSPYLVNGELSVNAKEGRKVFEKLGCDNCHSGPYFTDLKSHRIGENIEFEKGWDTPTLIEVWRTAPYLFNGRATTLKEVFETYKHGIDQKVTSREIDQLVEYVNSL